MSIRVGVFVRRLPHVRSADTYVCSADMFMLATLTVENNRASMRSKNANTSDILGNEF